MKVVVWLVASAVVIGGCGADPVDFSSLRTPAAPSPGPAFVPATVPTYPFGLYVSTVGIPCSGCLVEIIDGPGAGSSATTIEGGRANFYLPQTGALTVRVSKSKYRTATK